MGEWLNTTIITQPDIEKPCIKLRYCPYGQLVEEYPGYCTPEQSKKWHIPEYPNLEFGDKLSCSEKNGSLIVFGHDCPVHYHAEFLAVNKEGKGVLVPA